MRLQGNSVLIKPDAETSVTESGIHIPMGKESNTLVGRVVDAGPGCEMVHKGDYVIYNKSGMSIITKEGETLHFISEDQILYIYE